MSNNIYENDKYITVIGARENNLKNVSIRLPKNKFIVMTGLSGSGKSSLAFDTLYQEGQRRYVESLSSYARQFLGSFEKPKVDRIEGLSPSISIDQKSTSQNPRSTVGTVTEIYDFLRLLYSKIGIPYSPNTNEPLTKQTIEQMCMEVYKLENEKIAIISPLVNLEKGSFEKLFQDLKKEGFGRVIIDNEYYLLEDVTKLEKNKKHTIELVIDRIVVSSDKQHRIYNSIELACRKSNGKAIIELLDKKERIFFNENYSAKGETFNIPDLEPRLFSFNTPIGACPSCKGLGFYMKVDKDLLLDLDKPLLLGGLLPYKNSDEESLNTQEIEQVAKYYNIDITKNINELNERDLDIFLYGSKDPIKMELISKNGKTHYKDQHFEGIVNELERRYWETQSEWIRTWIEGFMRESICLECNGARLNKQALSVKVGGLNIFELTHLSIEKTIDFFKNLKLNNTEKQISELILTEVNDRLSFLYDVGLDYLQLSRRASTLSGGEAQRIRLATQIGSKLSGVLYVMDEPSIGLHQADNDKLLNTLKAMRDLGNTLIVVEHDEETMLASDYLVDIGPGAGANGGNVVSLGTPIEVMNDPNSLTGRYLSKKEKIETPLSRRKINKDNYILIEKASENNLKEIDVKFYLNVLTIVTGVSGSGKSTLVNDILLNSLKQKYYKSKERPGKAKKVDDFNKIEKIVEISQTPIGRTPRSNPATYTGVFDHIREVFSQTKEAKQRGYQAGRFSFNVKGGRCEVCKGDGIKRTTMHFLPDVYVKCEYCKGKRYNIDTLDIKFKEKTISDVLDMRVEEALVFFENNKKIYDKLKVLNDVGLGYIQLGQSATTLSGGEAQRVKLASELYKKITEKTLFILDEPTTGLHQHDIKQLVKVLHNIVDQGATMIIIEHNLDVIKQADQIIDLGPFGGEKGGYLLKQATPEELLDTKDSQTAIYLKKVL